MLKKYSGVIVSIALIFISIIIWTSSFSMRSLSDVSIGPGFVPRLLGISLAFLALIQLYNEIKKISKEKALSTEGDKEKTIETKSLSVEKKYSFLLTFLAIFIFVALLESVGFLIMTILYIFCQTYIYTYKKAKSDIIRYVIISVVAGIMIYIVFVYGFQLRLPQGILKNIF